MSRSRKPSFFWIAVLGPIFFVPFLLKRSPSKGFFLLSSAALAGVVLATGIISFAWEDGRPTFSFDRMRAREVKQRAGEKIGDLRENTADRRANAPRLTPGSDDERSPAARFAADWRDDDTVGDKVTNRVDQWKDNPNNSDRSWGVLPSPPVSSAESKRLLNPFGTEE
jgi:hypothetical protein